nr:DUF2613 domain-containing protein [Corynebacterium xerosis]
MVYSCVHSPGTLIRGVKHALRDRVGAAPHVGPGPGQRPCRRPPRRCLIFGIAQVTQESEIPEAQAASADEALMGGVEYGER